MNRLRWIVQETHGTKLSQSWYWEESFGAVSCFWSDTIGLSTAVVVLALAPSYEWSWKDEVRKV